MLAAASLLVLAIPFVDDWVLQHARRVGSGPAAEPAAGDDLPLRRPERHPRHRLADRRAAEGALARRARPDGRTAVRDLDRRLDRGHVRDGVLADPRARHRPGARLGRCGADARGRRGRASSSGSALAGARRARAGGRVPRRGRLAGPGPGRHGLRRRSSATGRRSTASSATSSGSARRRTPQSGYTILHTKDSQYHRIAVVEDDDSRYLRFDSSFQSGMYKDDPYRTRFEYSDYLQLPLAYRPSTRRILYVGLGGGSAPKRTWRDFPATRIDVVELDPEVVDVRLRVLRRPARPAAARRGRGRPPLPRRATRGPGTRS